MAAGENIPVDQTLLLFMERLYRHMQSAMARTVIKDARFYGERPMDAALKERVKRVAKAHHFRCEVGVSSATNYSVRLSFAGGGQ